MKSLIIFLNLYLSFGYRFSTPKPQLYGEWTVWHSHHLSYKGSNRMLVRLYPESTIEVCYREYIGPWLIETRKFGEFNLDDDIEYNQDHMKNKFDPVCKSNVSIQYQKKEYKLLSFLGIGFDNVSPLRSEDYNIKLKMKLYIVDRNDLFLTINNQEHYHLIRSIRLNEPDVNIPISTLIATNLFGMVMTALIHHYYIKN